MTPGRYYTGNLPAPDGSPATPAIPTSPPTPPMPLTAPHGSPPIPATGGTVTTRWTDVVHFAATASLHRPAASVLVAKGSTTANPHWLPCGDKPAVVLVNLPVPGTTMLADPAAVDLAAIVTMGVDLLFVSDQPAAIVDRQLRLLKAGGLERPPADNVFAVRRASDAVATRATIGARYCVIAIVGSRAGDFPNAVSPATPGANAGWFLIR